MIYFDFAHYPFIVVLIFNTNIFILKAILCEKYQLHFQRIFKVLSLFLKKIQKNPEILQIFFLHAKNIKTNFLTM